MDGAKSRTEIKEIFNKALDDIRKVKTIDDLNAEKEQSNKQATENELKERKEAAKRDVQNSVAGKHYRTTQKAMIDEAMEDYFKLIDEQMTIEDVDKAKEEAIKGLAKIKTDEEIKKEESAELSKQKQREESIKAQMSKDEESRKAEELKEAKSNAKSSIENYVNLSNYKWAQQQEIKGIIKEYDSLIDKATDTTQINSYVATAKNKMDSVKKASQIDAETSHKPSEPVSSEPVSEPVSSEPVSSEHESSEPYVEPSVPEEPSENPEQTSMSGE